MEKRIKLGVFFLFVLFSAISCQNGFNSLPRDSLDLSKPDIEEEYDRPHYDNTGQTSFTETTQKVWFASSTAKMALADTYNKPKQNDGIQVNSQSEGSSLVNGIPAKVGDGAKVDMLDSPALVTVDETYKQAEVNKEKVNPEVNFAASQSGKIDQPFNQQPNAIDTNQQPNTIDNSNINIQNNPAPEDAIRKTVTEAPNKIVIPDKSMEKPADSPLVNDDQQLHALVESPINLDISKLQKPEDMNPVVSDHSVGNSTMSKISNTAPANGDKTSLPSEQQPNAPSSSILINADAQPKVENNTDMKTNNAFQTSMPVDSGNKQQLDKINIFNKADDLVTDEEKSKLEDNIEKVEAGTASKGQESLTDHSQFDNDEGYKKEEEDDILDKIMVEDDDFEDDYDDDDDDDELNMKDIDNLFEDKKENENVEEKWKQPDSTTENDIKDKDFGLEGEEDDYDYDDDNDDDWKDIWDTEEEDQTQTPYDDDYSDNRNDAGKDMFESAHHFDSNIGLLGGAKVMYGKTTPQHWIDETKYVTGETEEEREDSLMSVYSWVMLVSVLVIVFGFVVIMNKHKLERYLFGGRRHSSSTHGRQYRSSEEHKVLLENEYN